MGQNESSGTDRINLVIIFGGQSAEHDVSCSTAAHVMRAVNPDRYTVTALGIDRTGQWHLAESAMAAFDQGPAAIPAQLVTSGRSVSSALALSAATASGATVVMPLLHGPLGEDGTVQGLLELLDVPYVGAGVLASAVGMDKALSKDVLARHGIAQPRYVAVRDCDISPSRLQAIAVHLNYPIFVKPANMGSSVGVSKARDFVELIAAADIAVTYDEWIVFEEAIVGREIEVAVLGSHQPKASVAGEIVPGNEFYDYEDKYLNQGAQLMIPAPLTEDQSSQVRHLAIEVFRALRGEGLARVDFFFEENGRGFLCNEINTMPGFTPISMYPKLWLASGLNYSDLIDRLVELARERHSRRRRNTDH